LAYTPTLSIPLSSDDYPNITQALVYGPWSGQRELFGDAVFRLRATSYWLMYLMWQTFHLTPVAYHFFSLLLHIANTLLVYRLSPGRLAGPLTPIAAAAFFAIHEGHQEAIMWFSAINELLMFFFGMAALACWKRSRVLSVLLFALALLSKESAIIFLPLFAVVIERRRELIPYGVLAAVALVSIVASHGTSFRFSDGSFSLHAPFYITWPRSYFRELWVWGWIAIAFLWLKTRKVELLPLLWIGIALVPYSFLTYQTAIPSRQTYLASAGLAWLVGQAFALLPPRPRLVPAVVVLLVLANNLGALWIRKRTQFLERARPTQELIAFARATTGPFRVQCFPQSEIIAREAVHLGAEKLPTDVIWTDAEAARTRPVATFCYH
jgi:hypothetical protein